MISACTAYMPYDKETYDVTRTCLEGMRKHFDEVILVQNGHKQHPEQEFLQLADVFIANKHNIRHAGMVNQALKIARYDYVAIINNDISFPDDFKVEPLVKEGQIRSPQIERATHSFGAHASFFVMDKGVYNQVGEWDEERHDADQVWFEKARDMGIPMHMMEEVFVNHGEGAFTVKKLGKYGDL